MAATKKTPRNPAPVKKPAKKTARAAERVVPRVSPSKGKSIDAYISKVAGWQGPALARLHEIVRGAAPDAVASIKWGQPVFESNGPFVWMKAFGKHVSLGFWRGAELTDPDGRLEGDGDRMRHLKYTSADSIEPKAIKKFVLQAIELNRLKGNPAKRG